LVAMPGGDKRTVPAARPKTLDAVSETPRDTPFVAALSIPVEPLGHTLSTMVPGAMQVPASLPISQGPGSDGAGSGRHGGVGPGDGDGYADGFGGNIGGGVSRRGGLTTPPRLVREVKPLYTADAMSARIQGSVWLE